MLLDSHALLWWLEDSPELTSRVKRAVLDADERPYFSPVSIYELEWKVARDRLAAFSGSFLSLARKDGFQELPLTGEHAAFAARLAGDHRDPFDRLLAAQATLAGVALVTKDPEIAKLGVQTFW